MKLSWLPALCIFAIPSDGGRGGLLTKSLSVVIVISHLSVLRGSLGPRTLTLCCQVPACGCLWRLSESSVTSALRSLPLLFGSAHLLRG